MGFALCHVNFKHSTGEAQTMKHLHVKTKYGHVLTPHEIKAYKTIAKLVKKGNEMARYATQSGGYCQFSSDWFNYFHESDSRLLTNVIDDDPGTPDAPFAKLLAAKTLGMI